LYEYAYLANFDFLKYSEHGALKAEWMRPANQCCVELWQQIQRAEEEISRLNIEVVQVLTYACDEEAFLFGRHEALKSTSPDLAHVLHGRLQLTRRINQRIKKDLEDLSLMKGFTGTITLGVQTDATDSAAIDIPDSNGLQSDTGATSATDDLDDPLADNELSEEAQGALTALETCCELQ
jgi:hypothetical protein